ncbi:MAG: hypothetical protein F6K30_29160 [Cyanothece sp. SIO2G6]|nr:hypothetical protein [Cyanothece sp. SIO2G6]
MQILAYEVIETKMLQTIDWLNVIPAGFALLIFAGGMVMLVSGIWEARDK